VIAHVLNDVFHEVLDPEGAFTSRPGPMAFEVEPVDAKAIAEERDERLELRGGADGAVEKDEVERRHGQERAILVADRKQ